MTSTAQIDCKSIITEVTKVLDISSVDWTQYPQPKRFKSSVFLVDNLRMKLYVYPNGCCKTPPDHCVVGLKVLSGARNTTNDLRKLFFSLKCDSTDKGTSVHSVSKCIETAFCRMFPSEHLTSSSNIQITVKLNHDPLFVYRTPSITDTFEQQLKKSHKLSKSTGDITLIVKLNDYDNDNESYDLYIPPKKRQKRNHNNKANNDSAKNIHKIKACSNILKSASNVFERMLDQKNMMEYQNKEIVIHAQCVQDVYDLIRFMSTNTLRTDCNALSLIHLAHFYDMNRLFWQCINRLINNVSIDNFVRTIHIFDRYEITEGYNTLIQFAKDNIDELKNAKDFLQLSHSFRCDILLAETNCYFGNKK